MKEKPVFEELLTNITDTAPLYDIIKNTETK